MDGAILTPNELVLTVGGSYVCVDFGENRSKNATVRVPTDGHTDTMTDANRFYICPMLYASYGVNNNNKTNNKKSFQTANQSHQSIGGTVVTLCSYFATNIYSTDKMQ